MMKNRLKKLRLEGNLTLLDLSEKVNIDNSNLSKMENGKIGITVDNLRVLADFFGVSMDYLSGRTQLFQKAIPLNDGTFKHVKILGSVHAGPPHEALEQHLGFLMAKVDVPDDYFYLEVTGDSMSPTFEDGDYVLVKFQQAAENNQIVVAGLNGYEATVKRFKKIGDDCFLFADNTNYEPIKLSDDLEPYIVGVVEGYYRPKIK